MIQTEAKQIIQQALESNDLEKVDELVQQDRKVLSLLIRMAYDKETLAGWRAIKAIGRAAQTLIKTDPECLREIARRLLWSLSDESGGIGWAAPEILGEIISADPRRFSDLIPLIAAVYDVEERVFKAGVVYALARIAEKAPEQVEGYQKIIISSLVDRDPLVRIYALQLVKRLWNLENLNTIWSESYKIRVISSIQAMTKDNSVAWIYEKNNYLDVIVGYESKKMLEFVTLHPNLEH
jgi:hypothetical protein